MIFKDSYFTAHNIHHGPVKSKTHLMPCKEFTVNQSKIRCAWKYSMWGQTTGLLYSSRCSWRLKFL